MSNPHHKILVMALLFMAGCANDVSLLGQGSTPGAPAPFGYGEGSTQTSAEQEGFKIANRGVTLRTTNNTALNVGSEDGFLAGLNAHKQKGRSAETLVDATRSTLSFMGIQKDVALDKNTHYIETGWYNGYKAKAIINTNNLHASSLNVKIFDENGNEISPSRRIAVEEAIFNQTKLINYRK